MANGAAAAPPPYIEVYRGGPNWSFRNHGRRQRPSFEPLPSLDRQPQDSTKRAIHLNLIVNPHDPGNALATIEAKLLLMKSMHAAT
jgi:hypothetical protein